MRFGKIDYLNLLPFEVFIKKYPKPSQFQLFYNKKKSYPAHLNQEFLFGRIDAGFISSITALRATKEKFWIFNLGIIARKRVISVICLPQEKGEDYQSATSNALSKVLGLQGRVLIGDRALLEVLKQEKDGNKSYIDMGEEWVKKEHLPFVFGRLCIRKNCGFYTKMVEAFSKTAIKIPYYILKYTASKNGVTHQEILNYLQVLSYKVDYKAQLGAQRFYRKLRLLGIKPPKRFSFKKV